MTPFTRFLFSTIAGVAAAAVLVAAPSAAQNNNRGKIVLEKQGSFSVGGRIVGDPKTQSLSCDHGFVEFQIPVSPRRVSLFMYHSSSVAVWQNRWDGGDGFQSIFLKRGYPVYLWDGPRVGRANWGCETYPHTPLAGRDQSNFDAWRFGIWPNWFPNLQFPKDDPEAWNQATRARYDEFDTMPNAQLETDATAKAVDKIGPVVMLTNSAGGLRAQLTAIKSETGNVKGIVAYEQVGFVFPEGEGPAPNPSGPFGPLSVPLAEFKKLTKFPIQFVWGDNVEKRPSYALQFAHNQEFVRILNSYGGRATILRLKEDAKLIGNTHIPFADLNNVQVADLLSQWLKKNGLDKR